MERGALQGCLRVVLHRHLPTASASIHGCACCCWPRHVTAKDRARRIGMHSQPIPVKRHSWLLQAASIAGARCIPQPNETDPHMLSNLIPTAGDQASSPTQRFQSSAPQCNNPKALEHMLYLQIVGCRYALGKATSPAPQHTQHVGCKTASITPAHPLCRRTHHTPGKKHGASKAPAS